MENVLEMVQMHRSTGLVLALVTVLSSPALAAEETPGRYSMSATDDGMLRLDTQTGAVSLCTGKAGRWVCRSISDDRLALENEIDRLSDENQRLKDELAQRSAGLPPGVKPQPEAPGSWVPSDKHVEEFMTFFEKMMKRLKQIAESTQDVTPKTKP